MRIILLALLLANCGPQPTDNGLPEGTGTTTDISVNSAIQNPKTSTSIASSNNSYTRLVATLSDATCTKDNLNELIYAKDTGTFYSCEANLQWSAIDIKGAPGKDGTNGSNGKDGTNGTNGTNGSNGQNGAAGADGQDGASGSTLMAVFKVSPPPSSNTLGGNSSMTANFLQVALYSDGSLHITGEIILSGSIFNPDVYIAASKKGSSQITVLNNFIPVQKTLLISSTAGSVALTGLANNGVNSTFQIGLAIVNNGITTSSSMDYFALTYDSGAN